MKLKRSERSRSMLSVAPVERLSRQTHLGAALDQELAEVRADEPRPAGHQHAHRGRAQAGKAGFRPIEWYSNPRRRMRSGS